MMNTYFLYLYSATRIFLHDSFYVSKVLDVNIEKIFYRYFTTMGSLLFIFLLALKILTFIVETYYLLLNFIVLYISSAPP